MKRQNHKSEHTAVTAAATACTILSDLWLSIDRLDSQIHLANYRRSVTQQILCCRGRERALSSAQLHAGPFAFPDQIMCGIAGVLNLAATSREQLERNAIAMADSLAHRGPDDHGMAARQ